MKKRILVTTLVLISVLFMTGCGAKRVTMKVLKPAEVPVLTSKRTLAVSDFKNDKVQLSSKVEAKLASMSVDKEKYFKIANRNQLNKILSEQKLQASDLSDGKNAAKIGKLVGAQAIIGGSVISSFEDGHYMEAREKCVAYYKKSGECAQMKHYKVKCNTSSASVSANLNIIDVESAITLHANTITKNYNGDSCKDGMTSFGLLSYGQQDKKIATGSQAVIQLADSVAIDFTRKLAPSYVYYSVELIDEVESIELTKKQALKFEVAIKYIQNGRIKKAKDIFNKLNNQVSEESFEIAYNLGLLNQSLGNYSEAKILYTIADNKTIEPNKLLDAAINRIDKLIKEQKEAEKQLRK